MKTIVCYGDSNTYGFVPGAYVVRKRFDRNTRWTGRLQKLLDPNEFYVVEEGLGSRTTNINYANRPGYRGTQLFLPILHTHSPIDLVILMLGTNDFKKEFHNRTTRQIAAGVKELIEIARSTTYGPNLNTIPPILIVSPPLPVETDPQNTDDTFKGASKRAETLARDLKSVVDTYPTGVYFVDAAPHVQSSPVDGIHLDEQAHEKLAILLNEKIRDIFNASSEK